MSLSMCHFSIYLFLGLISTCSSLLYNSTDDVIILDNSSFYRTVLGSQFAWNVELYNSWCGHCINFAPTYKQIAKDTKGKLAASALLEIIHKVLVP